MECPEGFEQVACPGCGNSASTVAFTGHDWALCPQREIHIVCCDQCGLHYTNPRPDEQHLPAYYSADYAPYQRQRGEIERGSRLSTAIRTCILAHAYGAPSRKPTGWRKALAQFISTFKPARSFGFGIPWHGQGRLLDFGCGNGTFLRRMKSIGWDVTGIDFSPDAVAAVRASGIPALQGTLPHPQLSGEQFDVITLRSSLEHVGQPRPVLEAARDLLHPGGQLLVQVPNYASWEIAHFGEAALSLDLPRHLLHFTPQTLSALMASCGFKVQTVRTFGRASGLRKSLAQIHRRPTRATDVLFRSKFLCTAVAFYTQKRRCGNELIATAIKG